MQIAFFIGRIIFGLYWLNAAFNHFKNSEMLAGYAGSKGTPSPKLAVIGTGIIALLGGLSIILGVWTTAGIILLIIFLVGVTLKIHTFWSDQDANVKMNNLINFTKNVALIGALLMMLAIAQSMWMYPFGF